MDNDSANFAFIDGNNLDLSTINRGWRVDYRKFRIYLKDKCGIKMAYYEKLQVQKSTFLMN